MPEPPITADLAKAFTSVVAAADIWFAVGRELDVLPKGLSIQGVCAKTAELTEEMPDDVSSLLSGLADRLHLAPPTDSSYASGARCLLAIQQWLLG